MEPLYTTLTLMKILWTLGEELTWTSIAFIPRISIYIHIKVYGLIPSHINLRIELSIILLTSINLCYQNNLLEYFSQGILRFKEC